MSNSNTYRVKAAELHTKSRRETDPKLKETYEALAIGYLRLSQSAERNAALYDAPPAYQCPSIQPELK